ncbi:hypothetical protein FHU10_1254 [Serratia fonticola]|uniref:DUF2190 domain-containing protein n=1 Tax=Serratia fonticola TaxID=47917 RepID=A0A542D859_SERFO|nr:DUF2190 domain-containing protein [Serratia fonticola]TQI78705.1 hypothetical protein FHU09_1197 [Serratia fonticola]TQI99273.1 hypothetical protein FHU11_4855 [Serratia fonticola]TVZ68798.1 hypothetical protein FHU10_1254 [Serratia fonticola]
MNIPGLITGSRAEGDIVARSLVNHSTEEGFSAQAIDGSKLIIGVTTLVPASDGEVFDIIRSGLALVSYGADVALGDPLTANADGFAVPAAAGDWFIGYAEVPGTEGDIGSVWINPGQLAATTP